MRWEKPLSEHDIKHIYRCNESTWELVTYHDWSFGPLVKATSKTGEIYYCGGDGDKDFWNFWKSEKEFLDTYPQGTGNPHILPEPEFDLDEISKAQEIIRKKKIHQTNHA